MCKYKQVRAFDVHSPCIHTKCRAMGWSHKPSDSEDEERSKHRGECLDIDEMGYEIQMTEETELQLTGNHRLWGNFLFRLRPGGFMEP